MFLKYHTLFEKDNVSKTLVRSLLLESSWRRPAQSQVKVTSYDMFVSIFLKYFPTINNIYNNNYVLLTALKGKLRMLVF